MANKRDSFDLDVDDPLTAVEVSLGMVQIHSIGKNEDMYKLENVDHIQTNRIDTQRNVEKNFVKQ